MIKPVSPRPDAVSGGGAVMARVSLPVISFELSVDESVDTEHGARSTQRHGDRFPRVSRLEPHCGACCNIQAHAIGNTAVELKRAIDLEEVVMDPT